MHTGRGLAAAAAACAALLRASTCRDLVLGDTAEAVSGWWARIST
ncbi:hypothetical protein PUR49_32630 [Streptomyces sp. BE147]|nr:hypothetical protein [Streptomyces sp. BE147]MEE1741218.1 hypothetical protein [Streptomyces sp. BE147]